MLAFDRDRLEQCESPLASMNGDSRRRAAKSPSALVDALGNGPSSEEWQRAPGAERGLAQYNTMRLLAIGKMSSPGAGLRAPSDAFAGYGFSLSTPHNVFREAASRTAARQNGVAQATVPPTVAEETSQDDLCRAPPCTPVITLVTSCRVRALLCNGLQQGARVGAVDWRGDDASVAHVARRQCRAGGSRGASYHRRRTGDHYARGHAAART